MIVGRGLAKSNVSGVIALLEARSDHSTDHCAGGGCRVVGHRSSSLCLSSAGVPFAEADSKPGCSFQVARCVDLKV